MKASDHQASITMDTLTNPPAKSWSGRAFEYFKDHRVPFLVTMHLAAFALVYWLAFITRFDFRLPEHNRSLFWSGMVVVVLTKLAVFYALRHFHGWWRYVTFSDLLALGRASAASSLVIVALDHFALPFQIPRTVLVIDWSLTVIVLGSFRSIWRLWDERVAHLSQPNRRHRALIVGENSETARVAHIINSQPQIDLQIVGLVSELEGSSQRYGDLRVVGALDQIAALMPTFRAKTVLVAAGSLPAPAMRKLVETAATKDWQLRVVPALDQQFQGAQKIPLREVRFEDLLRRDPVEIDEQEVDELVAGKTVLITGAGGSIGSELCRQIIKFHPERLILLGRGENRIFHIERELRSLAPHVTLVAKIASVVDRPRVSEIFAEYRPQIVLHAAAHKHVPLVENNVGEAVINNVLGTRTMADLSHEFGVEKFIQISSDKAVHPTSVMGCTKLIADRYCLALDNESDTRFIVTRFGNVLGSAGSVIPLFKEQIANGGPITITDSRMTRFFMTIPEASQLVLQAASLGKGGEIFVLEMGEQVRIVDMARDLIRLAGLSQDAIDIVFSGIRPGEKLYEELYYEEDEVMRTEHNKLMTVYHRPTALEEMQEAVSELTHSAFEDSDVIRGKLRAIVPEFASATDLHLNNGQNRPSLEPTPRQESPQVTTT